MEFLVQYPVLPVVVLIGAWCLYLQTYSRDRQRADWFTAGFAIALPGNMAAQGLVMWMSPYRPNKLDLYAFQVDGWFGQPSFRIGQFLLEHSWLRNLSSIAYSLSPVAMVLCFGAYVWLRPRSETLSAARAFAANWFVLPVSYWLVPICGPAFAFPQFPVLPVAVIPHAIHLAAPPNGMPSGHFACALLVWWFLRKWRWGAVAGAIFATLTVLATLGSGQHYLVDLIVAVPYAMGACWLGSHWRLARVSTATSTHRL